MIMAHYDGRVARLSRGSRFSTSRTTVKRSRELGLAGSEGLVRFLNLHSSITVTTPHTDRGELGFILAWRRARPGMGTDLDTGMILLVFFVGL